jgi:hypothetical protein
VKALGQEKEQENGSSQLANLYHRTGFLLIYMVREQSAEFDYEDVLVGK